MNIHAVLPLRKTGNLDRALVAIGLDRLSYQTLIRIDRGRRSLLYHVHKHRHLVRELQRRHLIRIDRNGVVRITWSGETMLEAVDLILKGRVPLSSLAQVLQFPARRA